MVRWVVSGILAVMLSSCIDGNVDITVNRDFSGSVSVDLLVAGESRYVSSNLSSLDYQFLPLTEDALKRIAGRNTGLKLVSYSETPAGEDVSVKYRVDAENVSEIGLVTGYEKKTKVLSLELPEKGKVRLVIENPVPDKMSAGTRNLLVSMYNDRTVTVSVRVPGFITSTDIGELSGDPSVAVLKIKAGDLISQKKSRIWNIVYTPEKGG